MAVSAKLTNQKVFRELCESVLRQRGVEKVYSVHMYMVRQRIGHPLCEAAGRCGEENAAALFRGFFQGLPVN